MKPLIKALIRLCAEQLPIQQPIYDFGSWQAPGQKWGDLRPLFPGKNSIGVDMREGPGVDTILDLHQLELRNGSVGTALCMETLEHVEYPRRAIAEIYRVLRNGGIFVVSTCLNFRIHEYPDDFWRFTPAGLESLLRAFPVRVIEAMGKADFPHTIVAVAAKRETPPEGWERLLTELKKWKVSG
jgi:SAM-dependent methyltransferase